MPRGKFLSPAIAEHLSGFLSKQYKTFSWHHNSMRFHLYSSLLNSCLRCHVISGLPMGWTDHKPNSVSRCDFNRLFPHHSVQEGFSFCNLWGLAIIGLSPGFQAEDLVVVQWRRRPRTRFEQVGHEDVDVQCFIHFIHPPASTFIHALSWPDQAVQSIGLCSNLSIFVLV